MVRQHCPECGTEVPVDDATGVCHVGHRVNSPAAPPSEPAVSSVPTGDAAPDAIDDEPAPWVATIDDELRPEAEADVAAPPPPPALGSATTPPPGSGFRPDAAHAGHVHEPGTDAPVTGFTAAGVEADAAAGGPESFVPQAAADEDPSLEELAAMAAGSTAAGDDGGDDLSSLGDDLRGDLGPTPAPGQSGEDFDLGSLEEAVAELDEDATAAAPPTPDLMPEAPGPDAAPDPATAVASVPQADDAFDDSAFGEPDDPAPHAPAADEAPVSIRPDHEAETPTGAPDAPAASAQAPLDHTNFTASGKKVASPRTGGGGQGLVDKLKGLLGR